jgi:cell division protein FtsL
MRPNHRQKPPRRRRAAAWVAVLSVFIGELFVYTWCRVQCLNIGYDIAARIRQQEELLQLQETLKIEMERLKAPARIERIARQKLGLDKPLPQQVIVIP